MSQWKIIPGIGTYYVTTTIVGWQDVFTSRPYFEVIVESLGHCMAHKNLHLHGYVIMPNHAHYIVSTGGAITLSNVMRDFNTHTSRKITDLLKKEQKRTLLRVFHDAALRDARGNEFKVWQTGFHPIAIVEEEFFRQKLGYLHDNPVRKGLMERAEQWRYSSARNYLFGDHSVIRVECL